jgi:uncharacterized membrane protein
MTRWRRFGDRLVGNLPWVAAVFIVAGIVHIVSILAMPRLAPKDAWSRMSRLAPLHRTTLLPPAAPGPSAAPFEDPALAEAVCVYDLAAGPVRLRAELPADDLTLLSFHARFGQIYYSMTDRSATRGKLDVLIVTQQQLDAVEANDSEDELPEELRILAPTRQGFVLVRALAARPGEMTDARKRVLSVACGLERDPRS